ncbi:MAG TPA: GNAT family N-acetyltransferase [Dongiaceae bacterium]|jgi:acetyltransferase|nr:GNAT family N-acetyltransferase [Dongiaceae bacterium]
MLLEDALDKYPLAAKLRDGTEVVVRPLHRRDATRLQKFFLSVPEEERLFVKQPVINPELFRQWCRELDYERNLPLLMLHGKKVIGEATLHQRGGGWKRHIGLITLLTHPEYRGRDVSKVLVTELINIARHCGLRRLEAEVNGERKIALHVFAQLGFNELMHLDDYVLDMKAVTHDYVLLGKNLKVEEEYAGIGG